MAYETDYGALQEKIIRDLGYDITFVNLAKASREDPKSFLALFRQINPEFSLPLVAEASYGRTFGTMEEMEDLK